MNFLICYDISNTKLRSKIAKYLEAFAIRIQYSVFICDVSKQVINKAKKDILRDAKEANEKLVDVSGKIEELDKFYTKVFGTEKEDGKITGGLKLEIVQRIKENKMVYRVGDLVVLENVNFDEKKISNKTYILSSSIFT